MSSQIRSLAWKERREDRRASLGLTTAWILCGTIYTIAYELTFRIRGPVGSFYATCMVYGLFVAVFLAMRTARRRADAGDARLLIGLAGPAATPGRGPSGRRDRHAGRPDRLGGRDRLVRPADRRHRAISLASAAQCELPRLHPPAIPFSSGSRRTHLEKRRDRRCPGN